MLTKRGVYGIFFGGGIAISQSRDVKDLLKVLEKLKKGENNLEELLLEFFSSPKTPADIEKPKK
jgi:hypothetical protein